MSGVLDNQIASTLDCDGLGLCRRHGRGIYGSMARLGFQGAGDRTPAPQFMLKSVNTRHYQRPSCVDSRSMPVREQPLDTGISLDHTLVSGYISVFRML
jgi:hypothetical protein